MNSNLKIYNKYIKYKNKYINLQNKINLQQIGGSALDSSTVGLDAGSESESFDIKKFFNLTNDELKITKYMPIITKYMPIITKYTTRDRDIYFTNIQLNKDETKPVLFMLAGLSSSSFANSSYILLDKLDVLQRKFKNIYMIQYASFKDDQTKACDLRDTLKDDIYSPELRMNSVIANDVHNIIKSLDLINVHLLGKCNGAWITMLLLTLDPIYKALYLAVPGIPSSVDILKSIDPIRLQEIKFIFGWTQQDGYIYHWNIKSNQEKARYDENIGKIQDEKNITLDYKSFMYDNGGPENSKNAHEIYPDMIDEISKLD
jgi:pimeloyl-ACP methyl ester carboxylesterase